MFNDLLSPISEVSPSGEYLKDNRSLFRGYRNEFNMAQSSFRQLVEVPDALEDAELVNANSLNWNKLSESCHLCLATTSKDLEIFSWFTVSQLFTTQPLTNLASALATMEAVVDRFWDTLHPTLPEKKRKGESEHAQAVEIIEHRVKPLLQLVGDTAESGLLYMPLQMLPLVGDIDFGRFYKAEKEGTLSKLKDEALIAYGHEKEQVEQRIVALGSARNSLENLDNILSTKCREAGANTITFRFVKESLDRLIAALRYLVGEQFSQWPLDAKTETASLESQDVVSTSEPPPEAKIEQHVQTQSNAIPSLSVAASSNHATVSLASTIESRDQALANLQLIADYFLQHEPHSPIYLLLKRAIRWGGMSLPELLEELVGDNSAVHQRIEHLAGLESAEHKANHANVVATQAVTPLDLVQEEVKQQEDTTTKDSNTDPGLSNIEW
ncbi:ImpA family type VI secretion system protein [Vibrio fluminensis]|uniref:type VI secretion system protein TssA n=1 Tax=Vibrio fluminensis TaxID=2783614 RepID=UPI001886C9EB|nr:type VI secretion system ImpA family N-terminal domain-containing protein [Vibrio fluminensis]